MPPPYPKMHVKRIYHTASDGTSDSSIWIDILRVDVFRTVTAASPDQGAYQGIVWYLKWLDEDAEDNNPARVTHLLTIYNPSSGPQIPPPHSHADGTVDLVLMDKTTTVANGYWSGRMGEGAKRIWKNYTLDTDPDDSPNKITTAREVEAVRVVNNDLGNLDMTSPVDWPTYLDALLGGNQDPSQYVDIEVVGLYKTFQNAGYPAYLGATPDVNPTPGTPTQTARTPSFGGDRSRKAFGSNTLGELASIFSPSPDSAAPVFRTDPYQVIVNVHWMPQPEEHGGDFVLIQFRTPNVTGTNLASSPTGSIMAYNNDASSGTECPLTVAITELYPGARIVYQKVNLTVTPKPVWTTYLDLGSTFVVTDTPLGACSGSVYNRTEALAVITPTLPSTVTTAIGYHDNLVHYNGQAFISFAQGWTTSAQRDTKQASLNAGGPGTLGGASGYSTPDNVVNFPSGPWDCFDISGFYSPYVPTDSTFYNATFNATFVIQLPFALESPPPHPEIPAFSIKTTGYAWSADISVYPQEGISLDPTNPSFPLKWTDGFPPPGADGGPWSPFGSPSTNVANAALFQIFYEDTCGTETPTEYPFAIVVEDHLTAEPSASPPDPNVKNSILQVYPLFVSTFTYFGDGSDWFVEGYCDVPYGRQFQPPDAWGWSTSLTVPGPLPLIDVDVPA
jgi:hypothetical protein